MALVKLGGGVVAIAGKIAGTVFARNRYGQYARAWAKPVNVNSQRQQSIRSLMSTMGDIWETTLTEIERQAWNVYAANVPVVNRLGETMNLSGFNMFVRSNLARLHAGLTRIDTAPTEYSLADQAVVFDTTIDVGDQEVDITIDNTEDWASDNGASMLVFVGRPQNANIQSFNGPWRLAGKIDGNSTTPPANAQSLALPWLVSAGQKVFTRARITRGDGRLSGFFRDTAVSA